MATQNKNTSSNRTRDGKLKVNQATLPEMDRELRNLSSVKCNALKAIRQAEAAGDEVPEELQKKYDDAVAEFDRVRAAKSRRFKTKKSYMDMTKAEIAQLDLETCVKAIASMASRRTRYPEKNDETNAQDALFRRRKDELTGKANARAELKKLSPEELAELLAEVQTQA